MRWLVAVCLLFSGYALAQQADEHAVTITGKALNVETFQLGDQTITPDENKAYSATIMQSGPGYFILRWRGQRAEIFALPGDTITINFDGPRLLETIAFAGDRVNENRYLADFQRRKAAFSYGFFNLEPTPFLAKAAENEADIRNSLDAWVNDNGAFEEPFFSLESARIRAWFADIYLHYRDFARHFPTPAKDCPPELKAYLKTVDFNDLNALAVSDYVSFLRSFVEKVAQHRISQATGNPAKEFPETRNKIDLVTETFSDKTIRAILLEDVIAYQFDNYGADSGDEFLAIFQNNGGEDAAYQRLSAIYEQNRKSGESAERVIYKTVGDTQLEAFIVRPEGTQDGEPRPALAIFHGGGWTLGTARWGVSYAEHFAKRGYVSVSFQYRLMGRHGTTPLESVYDARSAMRWLRKNANDLQIDPKKIVALGWSAGGHIAASAAMIDKVDEPGESSSVSCKPDALVLLYPALDMAEDSWFNSILKGKVSAGTLSPAEFIRAGLPPMLIAHGTRDRVVPYGPVHAFAKKMREAGNRCELKTFENAPHLFTRDPTLRARFIKQTEEFLASLKYSE